MNTETQDQTQETNVVPNVDQTVSAKEMVFRFKKDKMGNQRARVVLQSPVPNANGIVQILQKGGKDLELLLETVADTVRWAIAGYVGDNENAAQDNIPWEKFTWTAIANAPRAERFKIPDEQWEAFAKDYIEVMPSVTNKTVENVTNATVVYLKKFAIVKTNKGVIEKLKEQLGLYMEHSKKAEEFQDILELLISKADTYLKADDVEQLISNL